jgi:hypothetical protein
MKTLDQVLDRTAKRCNERINIYRDIMFDLTFFGKTNKMAELKHFNDRAEKASKKDERDLGKVFATVKNNRKG